MKTRQLISLLLTIAILSSAVSAFAAVGGKDDPLISKSYVDGSYSTQVLSQPLTNLSESMTVLRYKLSQLGNITAAKPFSISAGAGDSITVSAGASFTLLSGSLFVDSCTGALIDVSAGAVISGGETLSAGHRYVCAEQSRAVLSASSAALVGAFGSVEKTSSAKISFSDVTSEKWFYSDVYYAVEKGLVNGRSDTVFDPDGNLSYAETIKLAACMNQLYTSGSVTLKNSETGQWFDTYVAYALANGIISSTYPDYDAKISRSDFVAIFYNSMPKTQYTAVNSVADGAIPDVSGSAVHSAEIYAFYRAGILIGSDSAGNFFPNSNIKRSEVATVITRMYEQSARKTITL